MFTLIDLGVLSYCYYVLMSRGRGRDANIALLLGLVGKVLIMLFYG